MLVDVRAGTTPHWPRETASAALKVQPSRLASPTGIHTQAAPSSWRRVPVPTILNHSFQLKHEPSCPCSASTQVSFPVTSNVDSLRGKSREGDGDGDTANNHQFFGPKCWRWPLLLHIEPATPRSTRCPYAISRFGLVAPRDGTGVLAHPPTFANRLPSTLLPVNLRPVPQAHCRLCHT